MGFMDRPSRNESEYQRWIWVVDRVVHYMLLWSIMGILLPISTKWLLTSRVLTKWIQLEHGGISSIIMYYHVLSSMKLCGIIMSCFHLLSTSFICFHLLSPKPPSLSLNWQEKSTNNKIIQKSIINHSVSTCKILQVSYHWQWLAEPFCSEFIMPYYMWICKFIG